MTELRDRSNRAPRPQPVARHGRQKRFGAWKLILAFVGASLAVVLVSGTAVAGIAVLQLESNIKTVEIQADTKAPPPNISEYDGGFNILLVGSDTREGQGGIGGNESSVLNDVTMLIHVAQDQKSAVVVSMPRDLVVPLPACENGGPASGQPINTTLYYGGLNCTVLTVQQMTGLTIQFAGMITFKGVIRMSDAVGGVPVCVNAPINDTNTGLHIKKAGTHTLKGFEALAFLRTRHGVGDGSDLGRISSQQVYLSALVRKIKDDGTLTDFTKLYGLASAATQNITLSKNFKKLDTLVSVALVLKNIPLNHILFIQYPSRTGVGGMYLGKVAPIQDQADALFSYLRQDKAFKLDKEALNNGAHGGSTTNPHAPKPTASATPSPNPSGSASPDPSATPEKPSNLPTIPGLKGQSAAQYTCSVAYHF